MISFSSPGSNTIALTVDKTTLTVFPSQPGDGMSLLGAPEEDAGSETISWPGEYDRGGIAIRGIGHDEGQRVSYVVEAEDKRCAFLNSPLHDWSDSELELLGDIDVLFIPGDDNKLAQKLIDEIDPRILVPLKTKADIYPDILKSCGAQNSELVSDYKVKSLPAEGREVVVLSS